MFSNHLKEYADRKYEERLPYLKGIREELEEGFRLCTPAQGVLMRFFYGTMPLRDAGEYEFRVFLSFVKHAIWLREHVEWCAALPEDIFVNHVLYYRINSEDISGNRAFFHEKLKDRIASCQDPAEAVLAINY